MQRMSGPAGHFPDGRGDLAKGYLDASTPFTY